jgi:hypothetical protein
VGDRQLFLGRLHAVVALLVTSSNSAQPADTCDIDQFANRVVFLAFAFLVLAQIGNVLFWQDFAPLLGALCFNLAGAAMQFVRLIRSAFHG